ncbi:MAG: M14 family zinc carboxypeptidase [Bacteroidota bacterium]
MHKTITFILAALAMTVNAQLQRPNDFLPHHLGEQFTEHATLVDYYEHVAANSDRVQLQEFGRTYQQRPQILAVVSTPENLDRIEEIRLNNLRHAGIESGEVTIGEPITFVWLGFSVHGNEAAGSEASMQVIYDLADPSNANSSEWLKNTVVLIEPSANPDGYSRYTSWYRQASPDEPDPAPQAREHNEPWPGGRVNHYLFDLNRDWAWTTQRESQNRIAVYNQWLPHVVADLHEQFYNSPYYFAPAAQPYHKYITDWQSDFQVEIGKNHAHYFDENGWLYFTKEVFDLLYPSYGDTYPTFNGAIGMTYEQGGHSRAGRAIQMQNGDILTLLDRITHHITTALSTVEISSKNAGRLVENFKEYFNTSKNNPPGEYNSFIIKSTNPMYKIKTLTQLLDRHGIEYGRAGGGGASVSGYDYATGRLGRTVVDADDLIISSNQPKGLFVQVLFEPEPELLDSLTYDITAWSLMHAHGLEGLAVKQIISHEDGYDFPKAKVMEKVAKTPYAYLLKWNSMQSAKVLSELLKHHVVVRYAEAPFSVEGNSYAAGTLILTKADNRKHENFDNTVLAAAAKFAAELTTVQTGFVDSGSDFGSGSMRLIKKPEVLVLSGEKTFSNEFGQVWFYFDKDIDYPATIIDADQLGRINLDDYNTIVLPEGYFSWNENNLNKMSEWASAGGRIIAIGAANRSLAGKNGFSLKKYAKDSDEQSAKSEAEQIALDHRTAIYKDRVRASLVNNMPGAVVRAKVDNSHPLGFGLKDYYFSLKTGSSYYDLVKGAWNVGFLEDDFIAHGFIGSNLKNKLNNTTIFTVQNKGNGRVIYLIDNPLFRSFWEEGKLVFSNALFLAN